MDANSKSGGRDGQVAMLSGMKGVTFGAGRGCAVLKRNSDVLRNDSSDRWYALGLEAPHAVGGCSSCSASRSGSIFKTECAEPVYGRLSNRRRRIKATYHGVFTLEDVRDGLPRGRTISMEPTNVHDTSLLGSRALRDGDGALLLAILYRVDTDPRGVVGHNNGPTCAVK